ncbi:DUF2934 domain-containing protein [Thalassococcus profundi]|uniref:DUF2934 domain-containing protein n=1 Tax=Thalassococcus profundi TaxID=2282382 RepID=A0A369TNS8_9RHOB|nr:DUF2934 domain-containing protein [Thalassococcus profundi]RDD66512.1 DUF2934 domain-containing protein [Thalassococcus profundi]
MPTPRIDDTQIAQAAYFLWLDEGQPDGRADAHWMQAVEALKATAPKPKVRKPRAKAAAAPKKAATPNKAAAAGAKTSKVTKPRKAARTA